MGKYALFLGCTIPYRLPYMETALRKVLPKFGIELVDLPFGCCPDPIGVQSFNEQAYHTLAARNICIAEEMGLDILTACTGCFATLKVTNEKLKRNPELKDQVNHTLQKVDREYKGSIAIKHFSQVLHEDIGLEKIATKIQKPLTNIKIATHTGCHFSKPQEFMQTEDPENPSHLDELVEALGATAVPYLKKNLCCGAGVRGIQPEISMAIAHEKVIEIDRSQAAAMVTICPTCFVSYDIGQRLMAKQIENAPKIPVFMYLELLGLAMGMDLSAGFKMHTIKVKPFLEQVERINTKSTPVPTLTVRASEP